MKAQNNKDWIDLPRPLNCFTVRSATMVNLDTKKIVQYYSANTKIVVVQRLVTQEGTFYRTNEAVSHNLNYAFRASAFGLLDEKAPSVPSPKPNSLGKRTYLPPKSKPESRKTNPVKKTKTVSKAVTPKGGEGKQHKNWLSKIFRRKYGITKNS